MTKSEFYKDRILWRAQQHHLLQKKCLTYSQLTDSQLKKIIAFSPKSVPVLVFWNSETLWTVLTTEEVLSFYDNTIHRIDLDAIEKKIKVNLDQSSERPKFSTEFLILGANQIKIWVFAGNELFALYNILRMFPLNYSES